MQKLQLLLFMAAFILFLLAVIPATSRFNLTAAGLACLTAAELVGNWKP